MTQKDFARLLMPWKQELTEEIMPHYQGGNRARGDQAFDRWRERFSKFLKEYTPHEAERFEQAMYRSSGVVIFGEHPFKTFMREDGDTCIAFIDELEEAARKGRLIDFQKIAITQPYDYESLRAIEKDNFVVFVDPTRLDELRSLNSSTFDLSKLIKTCDELNICFASGCFLATIMLVRSILDHVPPIFDCISFLEVANNYSASTKSFKESMQHLQNSSRKIADSHLHVQIRTKEVLPNRTQVNFSSDLDVLLSEIVRVLK